VLRRTAAMNVLHAGQDGWRIGGIAQALVRWRSALVARHRDWRLAMTGGVVQDGFQRALL
jgi:hypothetical protein